MRILYWHSLLFLAVAFAACGGRSPAMPSSPTPPVTVYEPDNGVSLPILVKEVRPNYTSAAIAARVQGVVQLSAVVLTNGTVGDVAVLRSLDTTYGLDQQAVIAVKQWLFMPGMKDGLPVAVTVTIEMSFTLTS